MKAEIKRLLKGNHNTSRKQLQKLAKVYCEIEKIALEIKGISQFEIKYLIEKLLEKLEKMQKIVYTMCKNNKRKAD